MQGLRSEEKIVKIAKHQNLMQADIILGSETNINSETPPHHYELPGFNSRKFTGSSRKIGRGLILYTKVKVLNSSVNSLMKEDAEYVRYDLVMNEKIVNIVFLYRSPHYPITNFRSDLNELAEELSLKDNVLIIGDMNTEEIFLNLTSSGYEQKIQCQTTSGMDGKKIDQAYTHLKDFEADRHVLYKSFSKSHHHPICINLY